MIAFPVVLFWLHAQRARSKWGFGKRACVFHKSLSHERTVVHSVFITLLWTFSYWSHIPFLLKRIFQRNYIILHVAWNIVIPPNFQFVTRFKSHAEQLLNFPKPSFTGERLILNNLYKKTQPSNLFSLRCGQIHTWTSNFTQPALRLHKQSYLQRVFYKVFLSMCPKFSDTVLRCTFRTQFPRNRMKIITLTSDKLHFPFTTRFLIFYRIRYEHKLIFTQSCT